MPGETSFIKPTIPEKPNPRGEERELEQAKLLEIKERIKRLKQEIQELEDGQNRVAILEQAPEAEMVDIERLIATNTSPEEMGEIEAGLPSSQSPLEAIKTETIKALNDKTTILAKERKRNRALERTGRKMRRVFLSLLAVSNFVISTSFSFPKSAEAITYDNIRVENLEDWERIKLYQDDINKLDNINIINKANENSDEAYIVVDKSVGFAHLYRGDSLISTYEIGTGEKIGDEQTKTIVEDGRVYWNQGNKQTGAGIYTINKKGTFEGATSFTMLNERGIEVPTAFHRIPEERVKFFNNQNVADNRMSNGCLNFQARSLDDLARQKGIKRGTKVYILPDDPHNKFQIVDGKLRFISNQQNVNRTIKPYEAKPIILKAEGANDRGKEFLQTIAKNKKRLMSLYPTVSNDVYNQLTKIAYGIFGQESSFGTYGGLRGQTGRIADRLGEKLDKNVSAGVTQIRITSVNPKIKEIFGIKKTEDLFDIKKSSIVTMSLLLDIYTTNIPDIQKSNYQNLVPFYYNNPSGFKKNIEANKKMRSVYVQRVKNYSKRVHIYLAR